MEMTQPQHDRGEVSIALDHLHETIEALLKTDILLANALEPILADRPLTDAPDDERPRVKLVPLADRIYNSNVALRQLYERQQTLLDRISL